MFYPQSGLQQSLQNCTLSLVPVRQPDGQLGGARQKVHQTILNFSFCTVFETRNTQIKRGTLKIIRLRAEAMLIDDAQLHHYVCQSLPLTVNNRLVP